MRVLASALARKREELGISQLELARTVGLSPNTLGPVENLWRAAWPKLRRDVARVLQVPEEVLFPPDEVLRQRVSYQAIVEKGPST